MFRRWILPLLLLLLAAGLVGTGRGWLRGAPSPEEPLPPPGGEVRAPLAGSTRARRLQRSPAEGREQGDPLSFAELFDRALALMPPAMLRVGCSQELPGFSPAAGDSLDRVRRLLARAATRPGAGTRARQILADALVLLQGTDLPTGEVERREYLRTHHFHLCRLQGALLLVRLELQRLGGQEERPRPARSPLTGYVSSLLELPLISRLGGRVTLELLGEKEKEPGRRVRYLRGVHRPLVENLLQGDPALPWLAPVMRHLYTLILENMAALGELGAREYARSQAAVEGVADIGVPWESPEAESAFLVAWNRLGRGSEKAAYTGRRRLASVLAARTPDQDGALRILDRFYHTYPHFHSVEPAAWPNLACKGAGVVAVTGWIEARWRDPRYLTACLDALQGLIRSRAATSREEGERIDRFLVRTWRRAGLAPLLRSQALRGLAGAGSLSDRLLARVLDEAWGAWDAGGGPERMADYLFLLGRLVAGRGEENFRAHLGELEGLRGEENLPPRLAREIGRVLASCGR